MKKPSTDKPDGRRKLTVAIVRELRRRYARGETPYKLAAQYRYTGISYGGVLEAIQGRSWAWIETDPDWYEKLRVDHARSRAQQRKRALTQQEQQDKEKRTEHARLLKVWSRALTTHARRHYFGWSDELLAAAHEVRDCPHGLSLQEMADACGLTRERIRQILRIPYADK